MQLREKEQSEAQIKFNETYISSIELQKDLRVTRSAILYARRKGLLPGPIVVNNWHLILWERVVLQPYIDEWRERLNARRDYAV